MAKRQEKKKGRPLLRRLESRSQDPESSLSFLMVANDSVQTFQYDSKQTYMVSYAISQQTSPLTSCKSLGPETTLSCLQVVIALIKKGVVPKDHVKLFTATKDPDICCFKGMEQSFKEVASDVGENGLFIFQFSGHGLNLEERREGQFGLVPSDFDQTMSTFITGSLLNQWLLDSKCKGRHVIFILDCCYAGGLGNDVTAGVPNLRSGLYVLSASTALETSLVIEPLGNSMFTYFLAYAILKFDFDPGTLPVSLIFEECRELCIALSSLMISYHGPHFGLVFDKFKPEMHHFDVKSTSVREESLESLEKKVNAWIEESMRDDPSSPTSPQDPACSSISKLSFVLRYYKLQEWWQTIVKKGKRHVLSEICQNWLLFTAGSLSPLNALARRELLNNEVLCAVLCCMSWSVASIHIAVDQPKSAIDPDVFLAGFVHAVAALDSFRSSPVTLKELNQAWGFYQAVLAKHKLNDAQLLKLHKRLEADFEAEERAREAQRQLSQEAAAIPQDKRISIPRPEGAGSGSRRLELETITEESQEVSLSSSDPASTGSVKSPVTTSPTLPREFAESGRIVEIPELASPSLEGGPDADWQMQAPTCSIVPSMRRECILPTLLEQCEIPPELVEDRSVVADSLVLQTLQPRRLRSYLDSTTAKRRSTRQQRRHDVVRQPKEFTSLVSKMWIPLDHRD